MRLIHGRLRYFEITRGVRQWCPLSPSLFILAVELLALKIRQSPDCRGIHLPNDKEARISQFADDTTIINIGTQSVQELFFCDSIRRTVYRNDLVKFFWLRCTARKKLGIYDVHTMLHR